MSERSGPAVMLRLCLYIAGDLPNSVAAERNLRRLLARFPGTCELEIRDVLADPASGLAAKVFATPTLVKWQPLPEARVVGDLRDLELLRNVLGLVEGGAVEPQVGSK